MTCCNVKTWSCISAALQLFACILGLIAIAAVSVITTFSTDKNFEIDERSVTAFVIIVSLLCVLGIGLLVTLLVGIGQKRLRLVSIYVYTNIVLLVLAGVAFIIDFVWEVVDGLDVGVALLNLLKLFAFFAIEIVFFVPILIHHKRMRAPPILPTTYNPPTVKLNREI